MGICDYIPIQPTRPQIPIIINLTVTCPVRSLGHYRYEGGRLKIHAALRMKAVGVGVEGGGDNAIIARQEPLLARQVLPSGSIMASSSKNKRTPHLFRMGFEQPFTVNVSHSG